MTLALNISTNDQMEQQQPAECIIPPHDTITQTVSLVCNSRTAQHST